MTFGEDDGCESGDGGDVRGGCGGGCKGGLTLFGSHPRGGGCIGVKGS